MLGRLTTWLRLLGFDTLYPKYAKDLELVFLSAKENRILLTRDRGLVKRKDLQRYMLIESNDWKKQLKEVLKEFNLYKYVKEEKEFLTICPLCNERLQDIPSTQAISWVPHYVYCTNNKFSMCPSCDRIYWKGTHIEKIKSTLESILKE